MNTCRGRNCICQNMNLRQFVFDISMKGFYEIGWMFQIDYVIDRKHLLWYHSRTLHDRLVTRLVYRFLIGSGCQVAQPISVT